MGISAPSRQSPPGRHFAAQASRAVATTRRTEVEWAWALIAATVPAAIVAAVMVEAVIDDLGMTMGMPESPTEVLVQNLLNYGFYVAVAAPLVAAVVVGLRAWRREGEKLALRAARFGAGLLVVGTVVIVLSW